MQTVDEKMNSNYLTKLCRLCLGTGAGLVNVFEPFEESTIASVLATHFRFQNNEDDGMSEWVCETCWTHTKTFHVFYKILEFRHQKHLIVGIKRERSVSFEETGLHADFIEEKYEETEITDTTEDPQTLSKDSNCDKDNKDRTGDQSESKQITDDKDQPSLHKPIKRQPTRSEKKEQDEEIRKHFQMTCEMCSGVEFNTLGTMRKHYDEVHRTAGYLTCCGKKFRYRYLMVEHIRYHLNPDAHRCELCGKSFSRKDALALHTKSHEPLDLKCEFCCKAFVSAKNLDYHVQNTHPTDASPTFHCDICGKSFYTKKAVYCHIRECHDRTGSYVHVCEHCDRKFKRKVYLKRHEKTHSTHSTQRRVQCDICGVWWNSGRSFGQHLRKHRKNLDGKAFNFPICEEQVQNERSLKNHIRDVHAEKEHRCTFCDKTFKKRVNLEEHIACHTGVDLYSCTYCDKTFKASSNMYVHRKKAHTAEWTRDKHWKLKFGGMKATV